MNCQDITEMLDNCDLRDLDTGARGRLEKHLAACPDCARDWRLFAGFSALPDMTAPAGFATRCRAAVASAAQPRRRAGVTSVAAGALLCMAAAAAIYLGFGADADSPVPAPTPEASPIASARPRESLPVPVEKPRHSVDSRAGELAATLARAADATSFTVSLLPLGEVPEDAVGRAAFESLQAALVDELKAIASLKLVTAATREAARREGSDYTLEISGERPMRDSRLRATVRVAGLGPGGVVQPMAGEFTPDCVNGNDSSVGACLDARGLAATFVSMMKSVAFPVDISAQRQLEAQLLDPALDIGRRLKALQDLSRPGGTSAGRGAADAAGNPLGSPEVVRGALAIAATGSPAQRAAVWRIMRGSRHPDLIDPLIASARLDAARDARRDAVIALHADFVDNDRVRNALEAVAREDQSPLIRGLAGRALYGEEHWHDYIVQSLKDEQRPVEGRIEALLHHLSRPMQPRVRGDSDVARLLGEEGSAALGSILTAALQSPAGRDVNVFVVSSLGGVHHPAITRALLATIDQKEEWFERRMIINQLARRAADPRVREKLQQLAENDPDADAREAARAALTPRSDTP